ncbi:MAG TPA: GGDEF domain-containing protein [Steroidobacteraceae bacterium]
MNLDTFPGSPYAAELQKSTRQLAFSPDMEAEYTHEHLLNSRALIRVACVLAAALVILRVAEQIAEGVWGGMTLLVFALVTFSSIALASIAWSPAFERLFLPWAQIIVPIRNAIVAAQVAEAASHGQLEMLMVLPILLIGPFFFMGLRLRTALVTGVLTVASFAVFAAFFDLPLPITLRCSAFLVMGLVASAVAARHLDKWSRTAFLETHLIAELAQHDALTGTKNRRVLDEHLARLWPQAIQDGCNIAILLIDVDHFKSYNDRYGHQAGDQALRLVAQTVQTFVHRPLDVLARYGGEEFAVVLYDVDGAQAAGIADRIRRAVEKMPIEHRGSRSSAGVTISVGVAVVEPTPQRDSRGALQLADQALYDAKMRGRNKVELMDEAEYSTLVTGVFSRQHSSRAVG